VLFAAYLALLISVIVWVRDADMRRWPERTHRSTLLLARAGGVAVALNLAIVGLLLGRSDDVTLIGRVASITLVVGGSFLVAGILAWKGPLARGFRTGGWLPVVTVLSIPSTLTLLLLVTAPLLFLLGPAPARHTQPERHTETAP
jgi:hypothetical protein